MIYCGRASAYIERLDKNGKWVFMAETKSWLQMVEENFPEVEFHLTSEV